MNKDLKSLSKKFLTEFYDIYKLQDITGFAYSSRLHMIIVLEILISSFDNDQIVSFEYLCEKIPKQLGKRTTIQTILNEGLRKYFFTKKIFLNDKRIKIYNLEPQSQKNIENWLTKHFSDSEEIYI